MKFTRDADRDDRADARRQIETDVDGLADACVEVLKVIKPEAAGHGTTRDPRRTPALNGPTRIVVPSSTMRPAPDHAFQLGQQVRHQPSGGVGAVVRLPQPSLPFGSDYSAGLTVEMPDGTWRTDWVDRWEAS